MAQSVTRCPKCDTSFRITQAILNSAKGAVRCGSCLHIFNARDYLVEDEEELIADKPLTKTPPKAKRSSDDDDSFLIDDDMESDSGIYSSDMGSNVIMASTFGPSDSNLFERDPSDDNDDDDAFDPDESWAESLLEDDDEPPKEIKIERKKESPPKRELFEVHDTKADAAGNFYGKEPPAPPGSKIKKDHFKIIDKLRENEEELDPGSNKTKGKQKKAEPTIEDLEDDYSFEEIEEEADYVQTPYEDLEYSEPEFEPEIGDIDEIDDYAYRDQYGTTSNSRYLHSIEPEPVEFNVVTRYPIWQSKTLWTSLACAAGFILFLQIAIFRFDDLSTVQPWRNYYAKVCGVFSCELPQLRDRSKIKASNLVVRSHPTIDKALMVDAILRNTARFPQTFPPLDLVFIDIKNKPLAARRFEAKEYLGGELAGKNDMPVNQPVHIAIEISDPGPNAVSYFITIPE